MRRAKFLCTAICALSLCGLILTGCEKGNENTETEISETTVASESVSETTVSETETETETETEISESSETTGSETESTENFDKVKNKIVYDDGENTLTAGQFIDTLENYEEFTDSLGYCYALQLMDMDENGIPEVMLYRYDTQFMISQLYAVTAEGKAEIVPIMYHDICDDYDGHEPDECYAMRGSSPKPYIKDGETLWISGWSGGGAGAGSSGSYILKYDGSGIYGEIIDKSKYERYEASNNNGVPNWEYNEYFYIFGKEVTEEEYERREKEYFDSLQPSNAPYTQGYIDVLGDHGLYDHDDYMEMFFDILNEYIDIRDNSVTY